MTRKLKMIGLLLVVCSAVGAVAAPAMAQQGMLTSDGPVTLKGTEVGEAGANAITAFGGKLECPGSLYTGHAAEATPHEPLESGATKGTLTPHFKNCSYTDSGSNKFPVTVDMNGCDVVITSGETIAENKYGGTGELKCPEGKGVQGTAFSSGSHALRVCTFTTTSNEASGSATLTNTEKGVEVSGTITNLSGNKSGLCGSAGESSGQLHFRAEVLGYNEAGELTEVEASD